MALNTEQLDALRQRPVGASGNRLADAISIGNVLQNAMAKSIGLSQQYVSDVARGRHKTITVDNAGKFAEYFGCAIEDLFPRRQAVA